ncbi:MAG: hypothetical protein SGI71_07175 [Verrucomicrobiota bacterium]|nr:hypothetical protein [Verrucomicrobiota bacterium]
MIRTPGCRHDLSPKHIHETWTRSFRVSHAGGMKACRRWFSKVTPLDHQINMRRTPAGVPAISVYAIDTHEPPLSSFLRRQGRKTK